MASYESLRMHDESSAAPLQPVNKRPILVAAEVRRRIFKANSGLSSASRVGSYFLNGRLEVTKNACQAI